MPARPSAPRRPGGLADRDRVERLRVPPLWPAGRRWIRSCPRTAPRPNRSRSPGQRIRPGRQRVLTSSRPSWTPAGVVVLAGAAADRGPAARGGLRAGRRVRSRARRSVRAALACGLRAGPEVAGPAEAAGSPAADGGAAGGAAAGGPAGRVTARRAGASRALGLRLVRRSRPVHSLTPVVSLDLEHSGDLSRQAPGRADLIGSAPRRAGAVRTRSLERCPAKLASPASRHVAYTCPCAAPRRWRLGCFRRGAGPAGLACGDPASPGGPGTRLRRTSVCGGSIA